MLLSHGFLKIVIKANNWHPQITGCLFKYNESLGLVQVTKSGYARNGYLARWCLLYATAVGLLFRILQSSQKSSSDYASAHIVKNMCMLPLTGCLICGEIFRARGKNPDHFTAFFNSAIELERKYGNDTKTAQSRTMLLAKIACRIVQIACELVTAKSMALASCINDSLPVNTVWVLSNLVSKDVCSRIAYKIIFRGSVFVANYIIWDNISGAGYRLLAEIMVGSISLQFYLRMISSRFEDLLNQPTVDRIRMAMVKEMVAFRAFQLVVTRFNVFMRTVLFGCLMAGGVVQIESLLMLMKTASPGGQKIPVSMTVFFGACAVQGTIVILVCFGFAGDFHKGSIDSKRTLCKLVKDRMIEIPHERRHVEKFLKSCRPTRIAFGMSNFIEKMTPLVFQMFCVQRLIDLLLLKK